MQEAMQDGALQEAMQDGAMQEAMQDGAVGSTYHHHRTSHHPNHRLTEAYASGS